MKKSINVIKEFFKNFEVFFKYQLISRLIFTLVMGLFWFLINFLLKSKGISVISNNDLSRFILSFQGVLFIILVVIVLFLSVIIELFGFINISHQVINNRQESSYVNILKYNTKTFFKNFDIGTFILLLYIVILIPVSGIGMSVSLFKKVRIPNFIMTGIFENKLFAFLYLLLLLTMILISIGLFFSFHFVLLNDQKPLQAMKNSIKLIVKNYKKIIVDFIKPIIIINLLIVALIVISIMIVYFIVFTLNINKGSNRIILMAIYYLKNFMIIFSTLMIFPLEMFIFTKIFYFYTSKTEGFTNVKDKQIFLEAKTKVNLMDKTIKRKKTLAFVSLLIVSLISIPSGIFFKELFMQQYRISIIGHRGGGGVSIPENSLASIKKSIEYQIDYVEVDVQRTKDDKYIINHDSTFKRMAGVDLSSSDMTLEEIKKLSIGNKYPGYENEKVPTLEETLDLCKNRIGIYLELKGSTADKKMADDVIKKIKEYNMVDKVVLVSLDYDLIKYISKNYNDIQTGFIYFLSIGDVGDFKADNIILEEDAATKKSLNQISAASKKSIVWTVNDATAMEKYLEKEIDGIITDDPSTLKSIVDLYLSQNEAERIFSLIVKND